MALTSELGQSMGPTNAYQKHDIRRRFVRLWLVASAFLAMNPREADNLTSGRLLDPDEARRRLESRLGPLHARLRLGIEREHEAQAFGQGPNFLHLENLPLMQVRLPDQANPSCFSCSAQAVRRLRTSLVTVKSAGARPSAIASMMRGRDRRAAPRTERAARPGCPVSQSP